MFVTRLTILQNTKYKYNFLKLNYSCYLVQRLKAIKCYERLLYYLFIYISFLILDLHFRPYSFGFFINAIDNNTVIFIKFFLIILFLFYYYNHITLIIFFLKLIFAFKIFLIFIFIILFNVQVIKNIIYYTN